MNYNQLFVSMSQNGILKCLHFISKSLEFNRKFHDREDFHIIKNYPNIGNKVDNVVDTICQYYMGEKVTEN